MFLKSSRATINPLTLVAPVAILVLLLIVVTGCLFGGLSYDGTELNALFALNAVLCIGGAAICAKSNASMVGRSIATFGIFGAISLLALLATAVLGHSQLPYVDETLEVLDKLLFFGFDWKATNRALAALPLAMTVLSYAYGTLGWQPAVLFSAMAFRRSNTDPVRFTAAWALALLGCVLPFYWLPARGAYVHFNIPFEAASGMFVHLPWEYPVLLEGIRTGGMDTLGAHSIVGLVTVPSFHACAATLLAWGFYKVPVLRWPGVTLNAVMFMSAIPIGGHYLTDAVAGFLVAVGAIAIANWFARLGAISVWTCKSVDEVKSMIMSPQPTVGITPKIPLKEAA